MRHEIPSKPGYFLEEVDGTFYVIGKRGRRLAECMTNSGYLAVTGGLHIHRAIALVKHADTYFDGAVVDHIDGNKLNNHPSNLRWVRQKDNINLEKVGAPKGRKPWNVGILHSEETRKKMSANHADVSGENNPIFGKARSKETKARIAAGRAGKHWYNNGIQEIFVAIQPTGFVSGRLTKRDKECLKLLEN